MDFSGANVETKLPFFQGGEQNGYAIRSNDVGRMLVDALQAYLYNNIRPQVTPREADRTYNDNRSFWKDALSDKHFPGVYIVLDNFCLMEWLPFAPGRYYTFEASHEREKAAKYVSHERDEYLPEGKGSMIRGGIGAIRLGGKTVKGSTIHFLGASSTGIAHQGIPIALPTQEYGKVMPLIKERGGCRARITGSLQSLAEGMPALHYDIGVPRYCFFAEHVAINESAVQDSLLTTVAVMFQAGSSHYSGGASQENDNLRVASKSWTFYSFCPGSSKRDIHTAAEWLFDYATRYAGCEPSILTDFDEHYRLFPCSVEFPLSDIVRGTVDWDTLRVYKRFYEGTHIENYIKEYTNVAGDQVNNNTQAGRDIVGAVIGRDASNVTVTVTHQVSESSAPDEVKTLIETLAKQIESVKPNVETAKANQLVGDFETLGKEVAKEQPRRRWYELSLAGLKEAAEAIGEIGKPIADTVIKLMQILIP